MKDRSAMQRVLSRDIFDKYPEDRKEKLQGNTEWNADHE